MAAANRLLTATDGEGGSEGQVVWAADRSNFRWFPIAGIDRAELDIRWTFFHHPMSLIALIVRLSVLVIVEFESLSDWVSWPLFGVRVTRNLTSPTGMTASTNATE